MKYQHNIQSDIIGEIPVIIIEGDLTSDADSDAKSIFSEIKEKYSPKKLMSLEQFLRMEKMVIMGPVVVEEVDQGVL